MLKHYFLIIYRSFLRFKSTFLINLIGLSTGLACVLLIYLWINDELNFDKFHKNDTQLYQVMANHGNSQRIMTIENTPDLLAETMAEEIPEVEKAAAVMPIKAFGKFMLSVNDKKIGADGQFAGKDFFNIFSYNLIKGNSKQVLQDQNSIAISEQLALKLFNTTEGIIGKTIEWHWLNFNGDVSISGVFKEVPQNSSMYFDFVLPFEAWKKLSGIIGRPVTWDNNAPMTYLVLNKNTDLKRFNQKIAGFIKSKNDKSNVTLFVRKYSDSYLYGKYENGKLEGGRIEYVKIFSAIAIFILIIACINFMNLSTAKAGCRLKEVGIKKAIGAGRLNLIFQYMGESTAMAFISLITAFLIVELLLPQFNEITGKHLALSFTSNIVLFFIVITFFTGLISGSYPALYLSRFNPVNMLKSKANNSSGGLWIRRGLVVFQFALSIIFIVIVLVVYEQVDFIETKNLGYDKDNILYFEKEGKAAANTESFLTEIKKIPGVINASVIGSTVIGSQNTTAGLSWEGKNPDDQISFEEVCVGYDMLETLGINIKEGRTFSREFEKENSKIIFNETAIKTMGISNSIGKTVRHYTGEKEIIGVVKDFNFESFHEVVKPLLFRIAPEYTTKVMVKISAANEKKTIENLQKFYKEYNSGGSFEFKFLDEDYQTQYAAEKRVETLSGYFAGLAVIISCLGLFGLAAFTAEQRKKEIGIRKVLGANAQGIVMLVSKDFMNLILIAFLIASPIAWILTKNWLQNFAYRIEISIWIFIISGVIAIMIALITVCFQAIKAAVADPVKSLKYE